MQVFKAFLRIAKKRIGTIAVYLATYALLMTILILTNSDSLNGYAEHFQSASLSVLIVDEDNSAASKALTQYLASIHNVSEDADDRNNMLDQLYYRTLSYALTIPAGFEEKLLAGETEGLISTMTIPGTSAGHYVDLQISQYLDAIRLFLSSGYDIEDAIAGTETAVAALPAPETVSFLADDSPSGTIIFYAFQYQPYFLITLLFCGLAPILITLNEKALKARTTCSSLPSHKHTLSLIGGSILYGFSIWLVLLVMCAILCPEDILQQQVLLAVLNSFVFLLFSASLTVLISIFAPNNSVLNMLANSIGLSMAFLCGVFVPQSMLPDAVLTVARFLPAYWYVRANNMLAGFGREVFDPEFYRVCLGIQLLFTIAVIAITLALGRKRKWR